MVGKNCDFPPKIPINFLASEVLQRKEFPLTLEKSPTNKPFQPIPPCNLATRQAGSPCAPFLVEEMVEMFNFVTKKFRYLKWIRFNTEPYSRLFWGLGFPLNKLDPIQSIYIYRLGFLRFRYLKFWVTLGRCWRYDVFIDFL